MVVQSAPMQPAVAWPEASWTCTGLRDVQCSGVAKWVRTEPPSCTLPPADKTYRMLVTECNNPATWSPATNGQLWQFRHARTGVPCAASPLPCHAARVRER